jgi:DNA-binding NtrC family response regulator
MRNRLDVRSAGGVRDEAVPRLLGQSPKMAAVRALVEVAAAGGRAVLVHGETGTGKGLVARHIHALSRGRAAPFITVMCQALPREPTNFPALFWAARGGSLLVDEVADMPLDDQDLFLGAMRASAASLRGPEPARCLATTHADLDALVRQGKFRAELHAALAVVRLELPPLRDRLADLPELVEAFLERFETGGIVAQGRRPTMTPRALEELEAHRWPGNVLELENVLQRVVVAASGESIEGEAVRAAISSGAASRGA